MADHPSAVRLGDTGPDLYQCGDPTPMGSGPSFYSCTANADQRRGPLRGFFVALGIGLALCAAGLGGLGG